MVMVDIMVISVLPIEVGDLGDLVRLVSNIRRERSVLISYRDSAGSNVLGFYLPPQVKDVQGIFVYTYSDTQTRVIAYSPNDGGKEVIKLGYVDSPVYMNVFVAYIDNVPHQFVSLNDLDVEVTEVNVNDLSSLVSIAYSTTYEGIMLPFAWYERDSNSLKLNIEVPSSNDERDHLLMFKLVLKNYVDLPFLEYNPRDGSYKYVNAPTDLTKKYLLITRVNKLFTL